MNPQGTPLKPRGGIEWTHMLGDRTGYTSNPVRGCQHGCRWEMPDGNIAICYAESGRERLDGPGSFKNITWHPQQLEMISARKTPSGIFIDSTSDLFGLNVNRDWIVKVIECIRNNPQHVFFSLTKNPSRFLDFKDDARWPANWLVGISYPPTFMFGKKLTTEQQRAWFRKALNLLYGSPATWRWISAEPLSLDLSDIIRDSRQSPPPDGKEGEIAIHWCVVGAASNGSVTYQPAPGTMRNTLDALTGIPIFFKGNLDRTLADEVAGGWREEFPKIKAPQLAEQNLL